jgi:acetate---CoA ligase (ADP-forming)
MAEISSNARSATARYPVEREADVVLRDGSTAHVRPVRLSDQLAIRAFLDGISPESIAFRFFGAANLDWVTAWSLDVDYADRFALVAETGSPSQIIAHAAYVRMDSERAEVAFLVANAWQGRGISTIMLAHLAAIADQNGIVTFVAEVLPSNHRMIEVFRQSGFPVDSRSTRDAIEIELPTSLSDEAVERFEERERAAAVAAVRAVLEPRAVAVLGASRKRGTIGGEIFHNLVKANLTGPLYPVNERADTVQSLPAYRSVGELPGPVDLAVLVVPAARVAQAARECGHAGVRALVVISAGFAEAGPEGLERQLELVGICRTFGMRLVGPNCFGVLNTSPQVRLHATFGPRQPDPGRIGFLSQSGALGIAIIEATERLGIGLSSFVAVGNKADLSGNDLLQYWEQDPGTDIALLYLESFGNPRKFARVARRFARAKPLLAVKSGRSAAGSRATSSHTGALVSSSDVTVDALFHQAGVIRTETLHELLDVAALLSKQPIPRGDRVAIVTNAGGPGIICADACQANGLQVSDLGAVLEEELRQLVPSAASVANPVDLVASASANDYREVLRAIVNSDTVDSVLVIFVTPLIAQPADVAVAISDVAQGTGECALASVFMTGDRPPPELGRGAVRVPGYEFPEDAARAMGLAAEHGSWRARSPGSIPTLEDCRPDEAAALISEELARGSGWLAPPRVGALLDCYGLALAGTGVAADRPGGAVELTVGVVHDQSFGPVIAFGAGGMAEKLLKDVVVRITPLTDVDAGEMVRGLKTFPLLDGYQGAARCDVSGVEDLLLRISAMVEAHPEIAELDFAPVIADPGGVKIAAARVRVMASEPAPPSPSLRA